MRKYVLTLSLSKPRKNAGGIFITYELFIYGDFRYTTIVQGAAFNVTHFESRITHLLYTAINTTETGK
jgi:hypothetical protein